MLGKRNSDATSANHYRSERVCAVNGHYFFATREGTLEGPYFTRVDALREIENYIQRMYLVQHLPKHRSQ